MKMRGLLIFLLSAGLLAACDSGDTSSNADASAPAESTSGPAAAGPELSAALEGCSGARPGAPAFTDAGLCSLNFLFRDGAGAEYIGTAGHCVLGGSLFGGGDAGEAVWQPGQGPEAFDAAGEPIGRFVYAVLSPPKDFALIRLDTGVTANPQVCAFGGPTGINDERSATPTFLRYYGSGLVFELLLPARTALALSMTNADEIFLTGVATPGDSGGPVIDAQGRAVGVLVTVGVILDSIGSDGINAGTVGVTRLPPQLQRARQALNRDLSLVTAPAAQ